MISPQRFRLSDDGGASETTAAGDQESSADGRASRTDVGVPVDGL